jgi:hypothetical protein
MEGSSLTRAPPRLLVTCTPINKEVHLGKNSNAPRIKLNDTFRNPKFRSTEKLGQMEQPMIAASTSRTAVCRLCGEREPINHFRLRSTQSGERHSECRRCATSAEASRRRKRQERAIREHWRDIYRHRDNPKRVMALTDRLIEELGGIRRVTSRWKLAVENARADGRSATVVRSFVVILIIRAAAEQIEASGNAQQTSVSDTELAGMKDQMIRNWIADNRDEAATILRDVESQSVTTKPEINS